MASLYIEFEDSDFEQGDSAHSDFGHSGVSDGDFAVSTRDGTGPGYADLRSSNDLAPPDPFAQGRADEFPGGAVESTEEVIGATPRRSTPRRRWAQVPARRRRILVGAVVTVGIGAGIGDALAAQAAQHAADRPTLDLVDASFTANADGDGIDLSLDLGNGGSSTTTVTAVDVRQPGLSLLYPGSSAAIRPGQQIEIVLGGQYDCSGLAGGAASIRITLRNSHGSVADLDFPLPADAKLPDGWLASRAAFCDSTVQATGFQ